MKRNLLCLIFSCIATIVVASNSNQTGNNNNKGTPPQTNVINTADTVVFDLSQQVLTGNQVMFPVSFLSDDTIFSLDFSFQYNQVDFDYDTMVDIAGSLQSLAYYNANDSTVRYTGYSLTSMPNNTPLVSVHFTTNSGKICSPDFNTVQAYLNGEVCSVKLITCTTAGLIDLNNNNAFINIYPNPSSEVLNVESTENAIIELCDLNGKTIIPQTKIYSGEKVQLNTSDLANGIYMLKTSNQNFQSVQKVVIEK